jgi:hypothetical protein
MERGERSAFNLKAYLVGVMKYERSNWYQIFVLCVRV